MVRDARKVIWEGDCVYQPSKSARLGPRSPGRSDPSSMFFLLFSWLLSEGKPLGGVILSSVHFQEASGSLSLIKSATARLSRALLSSCLD